MRGSEMLVILNDDDLEELTSFGRPSIEAS